MEMELFGPAGGSELPASSPSQAKKDAPLADRMRPQTLDEVLGQDLRPWMRSSGRTI